MYVSEVSGWFESLPGDKVLNALLPMQWQCAPPFPVLKDGRLMLYVPFQRVWEDGGELVCSPKLGEAFFLAETKRLALFADLCLTGEADPAAVLARSKMSSAQIHRSRVGLDHLLHMMDRLEQNICWKKEIRPEDVHAFRKLLPAALLMPEQISLYEGVGT